MRKWLVIVFAAVSAGSALGQANPPPENEMSREQRRIELRNALQSQRKSEGPVADDKQSSSRQLSSQEHAIMRRQLRQYGTEKPARP